MAGSKVHDGDTITSTIYISDLEIFISHGEEYWRPLCSVTSVVISEGD